ncbi:sialate O-acetylesterase [Rufibacter roseus]|uniref:Sialate O-acetylesterase n=1 Tax=Rufibacter roseus TaxID=1567108 RepID=A0ABW2DJZ2_9BACT|nr:sialate O-acetylesterase [Rufibacter roseus]
MQFTRFLLLLVCLFVGFPSIGQIKLPRLVSNGMVLQRDKPATLWGWASAGEKVALTFQKKQFEATADKNGKWAMQLPAQPAGGPFELTFKGKNEVKVQDVLFGDVWLCSGQSNMELTLGRVQEKYASILAQTNNPKIRQFTVPDTYNFNAPQPDLGGGAWKAATPENLSEFSAVSFFFARDLFAKYKVPIGLINSALGGSPAEAWISEEAIKQFPEYYQEAQKFKAQELIDSIEAHDQQVQRRWYSQLSQKDIGLRQKWSTGQVNAVDWMTMQLPGYWADEKLGQVNGAVWFRKEIQIPKELSGKPAKLELGRIVDADSVFLNGKFVGTTSYQYPPRRYQVPANVLREGKNVLMVRVISNGGQGGFVPDKPYELTVGDQKIDLKGAWQYKLGAEMPSLPSQTFVRWKPIGLYNAMIAPLTNYAIKGVIWYQGESNVRNPGEYTALMKTLIKDWRTRWGQGEFPFLFVQLANFMEAKEVPTQSGWAQLRQAQLETLQVPNTGMAVAIDLGEWNDIHPESKMEVGQRLALLARKLAYGEKNVVASGPEVKSAQRQGNKITLTFTSTGSGLDAKGAKPLTHFAVAGKDKKFVWAKAEIKGNQVVVWSEEVPNPEVVRYGWADNPEGANLYNKEGLPASPFEIKASGSSKK